MYKYSKVKEGLIKGNFYKDENENFYLYKKGNLLYIDFNENYEALDIKDLKIHNINNSSLKELYDDLSQKEKETPHSSTLSYNLLKYMYEEFKKENLNMCFLFDGHGIEISNIVVWRTIEKLFIGLSNDEEIKISFYSKNHKNLLFFTTKYFSIFLHIEDGEIL